MKQKQSPLISEVKDVDVKSQKVSISLAHFGSIDSDKEFFSPGAFKKTIKERGIEGSDRIVHLMQHDTNRPVGKFLELFEDKKGLQAVSKIPDTTEGKDLIKLYDAGILKEHSIGFGVMEDKYVVHENGVGEFKEVAQYPHQSCSNIRHSIRFPNNLSNSLSTIWGNRL